MRYERRAGLVAVRARLSGPSASISVLLAVDTGSIFTALSEATLRKAGVDLEQAVSFVDVTTASRTERRRTYDVQLAGLGVAPRTVRIVGHTLPPGVPVDGLLGLDFFAGRKLTIDFSNQTIDLD